ncbi:MAG: hypothetical protein JST89_14210 [Cyanobacteria bacterium SZAS-4]|nr:hypothetical protein [Cyanobacteria bacterium SZAS-4]
MNSKKLLIAARNIGITFLLATAIGIGALAADYYSFSSVTQPGSQNFNLGQNGLWLGSKWYHGKVSDSDLKQIAELLNREQIAFAYFHCRDIDAKGNLRFGAPKSANKFIDFLHRECPKTKIIAWIGAVGPNMHGEVNLNSPQVRARMAEQAAMLVQSCGYDGVQWDFEYCINDDPSFMDLLKLTRTSLPAGSMLSAAVPFSWNPDYIGRVSLLTDQIAIMAYDTVCFLPRWYAGYMKDLVIRYANAIADHGAQCKLMIGVPTYEDVTALHHKQAENLKVALVGVKDALADPTCKRQAVLGIAPYAEWTTDAEEWNTYNKWWLCDQSTKKP